MQDGLSRVGPWLFQELDLTQEQRRGIRRIRQQHMEGHQAVRDDLKAKERALYQAMLAADSRREDAERMQREVSELRGRLALARVQGFFEMRSLLTPEQLARLSKITKAGKGRRGKRPSAADGPSGAPAGTTP